MFTQKNALSLLTIEMIVLLLMCINSYADAYFSDDFEGDLTKWTVTGSWAITTESYKSGSQSLTDGISIGSSDVDANAQRNK